jgi:hypothetical protein
MILDPNPKDAWAPLGERPLCSKSPPTDLGPMARNRLLGSLCRNGFDGDKEALAAYRAPVGSLKWRDLNIIADDYEYALAA